MAALLETSDNFERPRKDISSEVFMPKDTLDQPCDIILVVEDGKQFKAHGQVLSEASPFFEKLLNSDMKETKEGIVRLEMFSESVMRNTLEFIYTGHVEKLTELSEHSARDRIVMADYLFLQNLKTLAEGVLMQRLNVSNCFSIIDFSERYQCKDLFPKTQQFILANFSAVSLAHRTEVLNMSSRQIEMLIASDEINVSAEEEVFNFILSWIDRDKRKREKHFAELFRHVRLVYVSHEFLCSDVVTNNLVTGNEGCSDLAKNAIKLIETRDLSDRFVKPRNSLKTSVIVIRENENFLCYFPREDKWCRLGTSSDPNRNENYGVDFFNTLLSHRGKLYFTLDPSHWRSYQRQLVNYDPYSDKWMTLPYNGNRYSYLQQLFVIHDELYALEYTPCFAHGFYPGFFEFLADHPRDYCSDGKHAFFITKYKQESNSWEDISSFDHLGRSRVCLVTMNDFIYFIGGEEWENYKKLRKLWTDVDRYDIRRDLWSKVADIRSGSGHFSGAAVNDKVFIVHSSNLQCQVYDERTNRWEVIACPTVSSVYPYLNVTEGESRPTLLALDGKLYNVIKERTEGFGNIKVECYDPVQDKWNLIDKMTVRRFCSSLHPCAMRIYKGFLSDRQLERFNPLTICRSYDSLDVPGPTSTRPRFRGKRKCLIT